MATTSSLLTPVGQFSNRMVMAAMTRSRSNNQGVIEKIVPTYYAQRSTAGLILTEGTATSQEGKGYFNTPGIWNDTQQHAWKTVADAVHATNPKSKIWMQLMHTGRIASKLNTETKRIIAPSALKAQGKILSMSGMVDHDVPEEMTETDIKTVIDEYRAATRRAIAAGFDGIMLHSANGYLPHQFLSTNANQRRDKYGQDRTLFNREVLRAMIEGAGDSKKVSIKISPMNVFNDIQETDSIKLYEDMAKVAEELKIAFIEVATTPSTRFFLETVRKVYPSGLIVAGGGYDFTSGEDVLFQKKADMVSYGQLFLANPDLPRRFALFNQQKRQNHYMGGETGYTDYPTLDETLAKL